MAEADPATPFWLGFEAFNNGGSSDECPYPQGSDDSDMWSEGFNLASNLIGGWKNERSSHANY